MDWKSLCIRLRARRLFSIAPLIYNFLIYYIYSANLKNFGILRFHRDSRMIRYFSAIYCDTQFEKKWDASRLALATACPTIVSPGRTESANPRPNDCVCKGRLISLALLFMKRRINTDTKSLSKSYIKIRKPPIADSKGRAYGTPIKAVTDSW
jgi:hypothetical protein